MARWGVTGDIHLKIFNDNEYTDDGIPLKLMEILNSFDNMCKYLLANKIDKVAILGDVNDTKEIAAVRAFSLFSKVLENYPNITFYIIPGNHDITSKKGNETAVDLLKGPSNIITIEETTNIDNITFIPFTDHMIDDLKEVESNDILMSHFGASDAQLSNGRSIRTRISSTDLNKWKLVLCGHYHKPQKINHLYYTGTLVPLTRAEFGEEKRFLIIDTETLDVESIPTEGYRKYYEFIIEDKEEAEAMIKEAEILKEEGNFVTVRNRLSDVITDNESNLNIVEEYEEEFQVRGITRGMTTEKQMLKYMEIMRIPEDECKEYLEIGLNGINREIVNE